MEILSKEETMKILGGTQNLNANNTNLTFVQLTTVGTNMAVVNFTGNDLEE